MQRVAEVRIFVTIVDFALRLLKSMPQAAMVEKASIDEAFVLCHPPPHDAAGEVLWYVSKKGW